MLTDILIADENEAQPIAETDYPLGQWNGIDAKGQSPVTLGRLLCLLTGESYRDEIVDDFTLLREDTSGDLFVCQIPHRLIVRLSQLRTEEVPTLTREWSQTDEMAGVSFDCAKALVEDLSRLSNEAIRRQKKLLLRVCL